MVEWSKAPHWKCGVGKLTEGSNPSLSAIEKQRTSFEVLFIFLTAVARENTESASLEFANTPICIIFIHTCPNKLLKG